VAERRRDIDGSDWTCAEVRAMTLEHLAEVRLKIADLVRLAEVLDDMAAQCSGGAIPQCPIVDALLENGA
jgi:MerR family mercuric resistance operon transcriptional regulator